MSLSDLKGATDARQLHPTPRRYELADRVMEQLRQLCAYPGGASDATAALCIALSELIAANYSLENRRAIVARVRSRIEDILRTVP